MKRLIAATVFATSLCSTAALAQVSGMTPVAPGPYAGASLIYASYSTNDCFGDCDKTDWGGKAFAGFMFTPFIGAEVAYGMYGKAKINTVVPTPIGPVNALAELKSSGVSGFLVGQYPVENLRFFGKVGFAYLDNEVSVTVPGFGGADNSDNSTEFAWGLGATYMFNRNWGLRAEFEQLKYKFEGERDSLNLFSVGVHISF